MPVAGQQYQPSITRDGCDATTTCGYTAVDGDDQPAGTGTAVADPADPTQFRAPTLLLSVPGEWSITWTFTGPGAGTVRQVFPVDPNPASPEAPAGFSYASTADLVRYTGRPLPPDARRTLIAASAEIDRLTVAARYVVDTTTGRASNPKVRQALAEATCELLTWWDETGLESGGRSLYTSASIAGVSLGWGGGNTKNPQADRVGPKVWSILMRAGLIRPGAVLTDG